ncbi:phosphate acetyltransferase [Parasediminibacterium paludis]|uniref:Phosphate acetyltransferase n=1 Tax=Parasediminibacterium paludis TaxID=908966 RepID=A0ABV8Q0T3_9BACT
MTRGVFIATTDAASGKSLIAIGLMNKLRGHYKNVAYFKPIVKHYPNQSVNSHIDTITSYFSLEEKKSDMFAFTRDEVMRLRSEGNESKIIDTIIAKYKKLEDTHDFVIVEGTDFETEGNTFELKINVEIAKNLGIPTILVINGDNRTIDEAVDYMLTSVNSFAMSEVQVLASIINKANEKDIEAIKQICKVRLPKEILLSCIPYHKGLSSPTMKEITESVSGNFLFGKDFSDNLVSKYIVGAMQLRNLLPRLEDNTLIVTPGDRGDIILAALQANLSKNYPRVAGMILTGGLLPEEPIIKLIEGLENVFPIVWVTTGTFDTVAKVSATKSHIYADNKNKIETAITEFEKHVDVSSIEARIEAFVPEGITPHMFQYQLVKRALSNKKHIVLPEGNDDRIIIAASRLINQGIVNLTLLGNTTDIQSAVKRLNLNLDLSKVAIVYPKNSTRFEDYVQTLYELRKSKNVTLDMARDLMTDVSYFGTMMVYLGEADGMVSGANHTTQHTIRPALQFVKTKPGVSTVSSVFFMCLPDRVSVFGDCAVNPNPTAAQLAEIAITSAESSKMFGIEPKIAMLSYSSGSSGQGEEVEKVRAATEIVKLQRPDLAIEGPIQYDAAVDPVVGKQKLPNSVVAGQASVLIFPDLNTGNNTYKAVQRETGAIAIGPMLQGLNKPVNDLSRGCTVDDIFNTVVITAIQAQ